MIISIIAFLISLVPAFLIFFWLRKRKKERYNVPVISIPSEQENVNGPEF